MMQVRWFVVECWEMTGRNGAVGRWEDWELVRRSGEEVIHVVLGWSVTVTSYGQLGIWMRGEGDLLAKRRRGEGRGEVETRDTVLDVAWESIWRECIVRETTVCSSAVRASVGRVDLGCRPRLV